MADDKVPSSPPDPEIPIRDLITQWERNFNEYASQWMGTEGFSQAMAEAQNAQLTMQKMFSENMTKNLVSMNMPTRDDVLRLAQGVRAIDRRLERIEEKLGIEDSVVEPADYQRPARTKKPPSENSTSEDKA